MASAIRTLNHFTKSGPNPNICFHLKFKTNDQKSKSETEKRKDKKTNKN